MRDWNRVMLDTYPWIRGEGGRLFRDKVAEWAEKMDVWYNRIAIKNTASQWASCSVNRNLSFSWKIFVVPETLADYIIIHELTHLKHMDHSKEFWADVALFYPDYKKARKELEEYI